MQSYNRTLQDVQIRQTRRLPAPYGPDTISMKDSVKEALIVPSLIKGLPPYPTNYFSWVKRKSYALSGDWQIQRNEGGGWIYNYKYSGCTGSFGPNNRDPLMEDVLFNQALDGINNQMANGTNLAVDALQARQTLAMLDYAERGYKFALGSKKALLKKGGALWLEYIYGWKPLMSSIYDTVFIITDQAINGSRTIEKRATSTSNYNYDDPISISTVPGTRLKTNGRVSQRCLLSVTVKTGLDNNTITRLTSLDPAVIAYELIPFSFIVDWMYDIGGYLNALESAYKYQLLFLYGYQTWTLKDEASHAMDHHAVKASDPREFTSANLEGSSIIKTKTRRVLLNWPSPRKPSIDIDFGATRATTTAALLSQTLRTSKKRKPRLVWHR